MKTREQIKSEIESFTNDTQRWQYLLQNKLSDLMPTVWLDNDDCYVAFKDEDDDDWYCNFDEYLGWTDGIQTMLSAAGIKCSCV